MRIRGALLSILMAAGFTAVAAAALHPIFPDIRTHIVADPIDPILNAAVLQWNATVVPFSASWWTPPFFYPSLGVAAFTENLAGLWPVATPVVWATGNPILTYNLTWFLLWPLSAFGAFLLAHVVTGRRDAALIAGLAFGFAPYRLSQIGHLQVLAAFWLPLALAALHEYRRARHWHWLAAFGVFWVLQSLANGYFMLFGGLVIGMWVAYFTTGPRNGRAPRRPILAAWSLASLPLVIVMLEYRAVHAMYGLRRSLDEITSFSAPLSSWLGVIDLTWFWSRWLPDRGSEFNLFPGAVAPLIVTIAALLASQLGGISGSWRRRSPFLFYGGATVVLAALAMGPELREGTRTLVGWMPYRLLVDYVPGFSGLRVPARLWMMGALCLSVAAACGFAWLTPQAGLRRAAFLILASAGLVAEGWPTRIPMAPTPEQWPAAVTSGATHAILELPIVDGGDSAALLRSITHRRRVVNGASGYDPPHYAWLRDATNRHDSAAFEALTTFGALDVVIDGTSPQANSLTLFVLAQPGVQRLRRDGPRSWYRLPAAPRTPAASTVLPIADVSASADTPEARRTIDGRIETYWIDGPQRPGQWLTVDLGEPRLVTTVEHLLGPDYLTYPRGLMIDGSLDGETWSLLAEAAMRSLFLQGMMIAPTHVPLRVEIEPARVRFVRLRQMGAFPGAWSVSEIRVYGTTNAAATPPPDR